MSETTSPQLQPAAEQAAEVDSPEEDPSEDQAPVPSRTATAYPYLVGLLLSLAVALLIAMHQLSELSGRMPTESGRSWSFEQLMGLGGPNTLIARWIDVAARPLIDDPLARLSTFYFVLDSFFILLYAAVIWVVAARVWIQRRRLGRVVKILGVVLAVTDLTEDLLAWLWIRAAISGPTWATVLGICTVVKWVLAFLVLLAFGVEVLRRLAWPPPGTEPPGARRWLGNARFAVVQHRLTLTPVLILLVLSVLSGSQVLDQLPDAQREWVSDGGRGIGHAVAGMLITMGLGALLYWLGRARSQRTELATGPDAPDDVAGGPSPLLGWLLIPLVLLLWLPIAGFSGFLWPRFAVVVGVCWGVYGVSLWLQRSWSRHPERARYRPAERVTEDRLRALYFVGDAIGISVVTVGGLSLLRSFVPMAGLGPSAEAAQWPAFWVWAFCVIGLVATILPWSIALLLRAWEGFDELYIMGSRLAGYGLIAVLAGAAVLVLAFLPNTAGAIVGVAGVATISIGGLAVLAACAGLAVRHGATPEVFRLFGFRSTPGVTLFVCTVLVVSAVSGQGTLHVIRSDDSATRRPEDRPTLATTFGTWVGSPDAPNNQACRHRVPGHPDVTVRPMIMVAAEGGGIRAAYWAVAAMRRLADLTVIGGRGRGCGAFSTLFSGGASGGSVGLTVSKFSDDPLRDVTAMARPDVLSAVVAGTFVRDPAYGLTGVPVVDLDRPPVQQWRDRARLMEDGWDVGVGGDTTPWGKEFFLDSAGEPGPGALILNSTSTKNNCRAWLSQVKLSNRPTLAGQAGAGELTCDVVNQVAPRTIDLLAAYARTAGETASEQPGCFGDLRASTAALLTARFPYVTPSGVIGPCPERRSGSDGNFAGYWPRTQLIDGGYIENTGLATITDLSPQWLPLVRAHNAQVLQNNSGSLVVPIIVFLTNDTQAVNASDRDKGPASELTVPPVNVLRGMGALNQTRAQLERARGTVEATQICPEVPAATFDCAQVVADAAKYRTIVVDRAVRPEISAPLGWVLSDASIASLDAALDDQAAADSSCESAKIKTRPYDADCDQGFGRLSDLVRQLVGR